MTYSEDVIRYTNCAEHCFSSCILKVRVRDGKVITAEPDDTINPGIPREDSVVASELIDRCMIQTRPCAKGFAKPRMLYDPNRLIYPMQRVGERGEGKYRRISWDTALDIIAKKMLEVKDRFGPYTIADLSMAGLWEGFPLSPWFGAGVAGWRNGCDVSVAGVAESELWVLGMPQLRQERQDESNLLNAKLIVLWGFNPTTNLSNNAVYTLLRAKERGIPIISIDQRYTVTAEVLADQWIPIRPTTDIAMMVAIANVWFKEDLCDKDAINRWIEPEGLRLWKNYVLGITDGVDKTPQWAENICGVPAETIIDFARLYARSKPVNLSATFSLGRQFYGENPSRAAIYLQALSGNIGIPGGSAAAESACEFGRGMGVTSLPKPVVNWQRKPGHYKAPAMMLMFKWANAIDLREKLDRGEITPDDYNRAIGNVPGNVPPNIKMIFMGVTNALVVSPDVNTTLRALKKVDFSVGFFHYAQIPTANYTDILLPQMSPIFEGRCSEITDAGRDGLDLFQGGWNFNGNYFMYRQKCTDPPGEIKPVQWFWMQLARRLGFAEEYNPLLARVPDDKWDQTIEDLHREAYEIWMKRPDIIPLNPPVWTEFQKKPVFRWEITEPYYPFKRYIDSGMNPFEGTESGKIEFYSRDLAKGREYLDTHAFTSGSGQGPQKLSDQSGKWYGPGNLPPMAEMTLGGKVTFHSKNVKKFPLLMSSLHPLFRTHSYLDNQSLLSRDCYRHAVWLSVADAQKRGIMDGDMVRAFNEVGEVILPAYVTSRLVPGTSIIFHGAWYTPGDKKTSMSPEGLDERGCANLLIHADELPETILNHYPSKALIEIEKWEGK